MKKRLSIIICFTVLSHFVSAQSLQFESIQEAKPLKRGQNYRIKWSGGSVDQMIKIELHSHAEKVQGWDEPLNDGEHEIKLSSKLKPGKGYSFKIFSGNDVVSSQAVRIRRKIPLALTISTAIIVPTLVILFSSKDDGANDTIEFPVIPSGN